jgi:cold shock CspA family protein
MRYQGRITTWKDDKGFGFITPNGGDEQVFVHISSFSNRQHRPIGNEIVTYELKVNEKGRTQANTVAFSSSVNGQHQLVRLAAAPLAGCFRPMVQKYFIPCLVPCGG